MNFVLRLIVGASIAALSAAAAIGFPQYAWGCGWLGASVYFVAVVLKR